MAIDGYAGAGKTTVTDYLAKQNHNVLPVHLDDFIKHWKDRKKILDTAKNKSRIFECRWFRYDDLEKLLNAFKTKNKGVIKFRTYNYNKNNFGPQKSFDLSKKILMIDGIFLFNPKRKIFKLLDKTIYLNVDFAKADKKRIAREKKKWGKNYIPENHPDNWTKYYKKAYRGYVKKQKPQNSDLVF
ncbi:MAG: AAA family ATPase [Patescibacteria group bacterium]